MIKKFLAATLAILSLASFGSTEPARDDRDTSHLPPAVARLTLAFRAIPGVIAADINKTYLPDVELSNLSLSGPYADLPAAALRRSEGALPSEVLVSISFSISRDELGLKALEFLAWWVRDQARGGQNMQLRVSAFPPIAGETVQLGHTLTFSIDWFYVDKSEDIEVMFGAFDEKSMLLEMELDIARSAF